MMSKNISKKVISNALVLSGGGTRGFAHIGVLEVLLKNNFIPDVIVGSSVGALVAVCYASGKSLEEIKNHFLKLSFYKLLRPSWSSGLLNSKTIVDSVLSFLEITHFSDLSIPVIINATNINTGKEKIFSSGKLKYALQATIAVPGLFSPVKIGNSFYVDGGLSNPLPVHLLPKSKNIFVVDVAFKFEKITDKTSVLTVLQNAIFSLQRQQSLKDLTDSMIYIKPPLQKFQLYETSLSARNDMLKRGRLAAKKALRNL